MFAGYEALSIVLGANESVSSQLDKELLLGNINSVDGLKEFFIAKYNEFRDEAKALSERV